MDIYKIRLARAGEALQIFSLIEIWARAERLQRRSLKSIEWEIGRFWVADCNGQVAACANLTEYSRRMAEIRSLAFGQSCQAALPPLLEEIILWARRLKIEKIFTVSDLSEILQAQGFSTATAQQRKAMFLDPHGSQLASRVDTGGIAISPMSFPEAPAVYFLIQNEARQGKLLGRSLRDILGRDRHFFVARVGRRIVGCVAHDVYDPKRLSELRSLVIKNEFRGRNIGLALCQEVIDEARRMRIPEMMTVTGESSFFDQLGFRFATRFLTEAFFVHPKLWPKP